MWQDVSNKKKKQETNKWLDELFIIVARNKFEGKISQKSRLRTLKKNLKNEKHLLDNNSNNNNYTCAIYTYRSSPGQSPKAFTFKEEENKNGGPIKINSGPRKLRVLWFSNKVGAEKAAALLNSKLKRLKLPKTGYASWFLYYLLQRLSIDILLIL